MSRAERDRGAAAERAVARFLRANGFPGARRYLAGDGRQPGDIDFHPDVCLEVKDVARSSWPSWRAQALAEARPGQLVIVVRRVRGVTDVGQWEAQVPAGQWWAHLDPQVAHIVPAVVCPRTAMPWRFGSFGAIPPLLQPRIPGLESA